MFPKKSETRPASGAERVARAMPAGGFSVLGPDVTVTGNLTADSDLHIDGQVEGDVTCAALVQGETSTVTGKIVAKSVRIAGTVKGTIEAGDLVALRSARIEGDVTYDTLTIEQGAAVDGRLTHRTGDAAPLLSLASSS